MSQQFASDNNAGICPDALAAMLRANGEGHTPAYGADAWTARAVKRIKEIFETDCDVHFVFNGTAANALSLAHLTAPYEAIVCHALAHMATDECAAPEFFSGGCKLLTAGPPNAKLTPEAILALARKRTDVHAPLPRTVSISETTELGTAYTRAEIEAIGEACRSARLNLHMDGARFANAVAALNAAPADFTWRAGVDVLSLGGTKNGLAAGEAIIFFDRSRAEGFQRRVKQCGQLASKMRAVTAGWSGLLENDAWLANARHANAMARRLHERIQHIPHVRILYPVEANAVFVGLPRPAVQKLLAEGWRFYDDIGDEGCRLMCAFDTAPETVDRFAAAIDAAVTASS